MIRELTRHIDEVTIERLRHERGQAGTTLEPWILKDALVKDPNIDTLFIQINVVNGKPEKARDGYRPELERLAANIVTFPLFEHGMTVDGVMPIPTMGDTFAEACRQRITEVTGDDIPLIICQKLSPSEAQELVRRNLGVMYTAYSYTTRKEAGYFIPFYIDEQGNPVAEDTPLLNHRTMRNNFQSGMRIVIADDFIAKGSVGEATVRALTTSGACIPAFLSYCSKDMQNGVELLAGIHQKLNIDPLLVSVAVSISKVIPFDPPPTDKDAPTHYVVLAQPMYSVYNEPIMRSNSIASL